MACAANLNLIELPTDGDSQSQEDYGHSPGESVSSDTTVYFKDLEERLVEHIESTDAVLGAVAWLTSAPVLCALARTPCSIVVQKEDFLRPSNVSRRSLHKLYERLHGILNYDLPGGANELSFSYWREDAIRCAGMARDGDWAMPRMHHKFFVFLREQEVAVEGQPEDEQVSTELCPYAVWTGSVNPTDNGFRSLENAVYIANLDVAARYAREWKNVYWLSEELDWSSKWVEPEYRLGT